MAPLPTGTLLVRTLADDSRAFYLRVRIGSKRERVILHERPGCACGCGGGWDEPAARTELGNILARIRVGVWTPPEPPPALAAAAEDSAVPTFHVYASWWLQAKIDGAIGDKQIAPIRSATTAGGSRTTCCRSSDIAVSTRSTPTSASPSRRTSSARRANCARRSTPAPTSATGAAAEPCLLRPLPSAS